MPMRVNTGTTQVQTVPRRSVQPGDVFFGSDNVPRLAIRVDAGELQEHMQRDSAPAIRLDTFTLTHARQGTDRQVRLADIADLEIQI